MSRKRGFTLLQALIALAATATLSAVTLGVFGSGRQAAVRSACDARLKAISLALDAHKEEIGRFPKTLDQLQARKYLQDPEALWCPADPDRSLRPQGSYQDFYAIRARRDSGELPIVMCPFHESTGHGEQAYVGRYTEQHRVSSATLEEANNVTVQRPADEEPVSGAPGMVLRGGDRVRTGPMGAARIRFSDGSRATLKGGSDLTVLQSFVEGRRPAPLYTLVRHWAGNIHYNVHTGSKFDVVTATATAGAKGTEFLIKVEEGVTYLWVIESKVALSTLNETIFPMPLNPPPAKPVVVDSDGNITGVPAI